MSWERVARSTELGRKPISLHLSGDRSLRAQYALSLPTSVVITGCESEDILKQAIDMGQHFRPLTPEQKQGLLARTAPLAKNGEYELFKTSERFDGTARNPKWLESATL